MVPEPLPHARVSVATSAACSPGAAACPGCTQLLSAEPGFEHRLGLLSHRGGFLKEVLWGSQALGWQEMARAPPEVFRSSWGVERAHCPACQAVPGSSVSCSGSFPETKQE